MRFDELDLKIEILEAIAKLGYEEMTPIQEKAIPIALEGKDLIGQAQTGTGKTASFTIPILQGIDNSNSIKALILSPTRELALQIEQDVKNLSKFMKVTSANIIGGMRYDTQERLLKKNPDVIIGTPGRVKDMIEKGKLNLSTLKYFVLDEADEMLKVGFKEEVDYIIEKLNKDSQKMLFSATTNDYTKKVADKLLSNPVNVSVSTGLMTTKNIKQLAMIVREGDKLTIFSRLLDMNKDNLFIVFCRTKRRSDELSLALNEMGYSSRALHGDLVQQQRTQIMKEVKKGAFNILVCTDVAARGLDITGIDYVINFDLPQEIEYYVHRIGRCGRAKEKGTSISFVREVEQDYIVKIEEVTNSKIEFVPQPSKKQVKSALRTQSYEKVKAALQLDSSANQEMANLLIEEFGAEEVVMALLELSSTKVHKIIPTLTPEPPISMRNFRTRTTNKKPVEKPRHRGRDFKKDGNSKPSSSNRSNNSSRSTSTTKKDSDFKAKGKKPTNKTKSYILNVDKTKDYTKVGDDFLLEIRSEKSSKNIQSNKKPGKKTEISLNTNPEVKLNKRKNDRFDRKKDKKSPK